jgi:hypothetical protein
MAGEAERPEPRPARAAASGGPARRSPGTCRGHAFAARAAPRARAIAAIWPPAVVQGRMSRSRPVRTGQILSAPEACSAHTGSQPLARSPSSCGSAPCSSMDTSGSRSGGLRRRFSGSLRATAPFSWPKPAQTLTYTIQHTAHKRSFAGVAGRLRSPRAGQRYSGRAGALARHDSPAHVAGTIFRRS